MKIFIIKGYDRHCPENQSEFIEAVFTTEELAKQYIAVHDPKDSNGWLGLYIEEHEADPPIGEKKPDFDWDLFDEDIEFIKKEGKL